MFINIVISSVLCIFTCLFLRAYFKIPVDERPTTTCQPAAASWPQPEPQTSKIGNDFLNASTLAKYIYISCLFGRKLKKGVGIWNSLHKDISFIYITLET